MKSFNSKWYSRFRRNFVRNYEDKPHNLLRKNKETARLFLVQSKYRKRARCCFISSGHFTVMSGYKNGKIRIMPPTAASAWKCCGFGMQPKIKYAVWVCR